MNKNIFESEKKMAFTPVPADTINSAGGKAYSLANREALAQIVMTGTFNNTFYASGQNQIKNINDILGKIGKDGAEFVAKLAIYARRYGYMKDTPAYLTAWLSQNGQSYLKETFTRVIDNGKMLRNFVQVMRSGIIGRKSLGTKSKKLIQNWLNTASIDTLIRASVGNDPSLKDILKMVHPRPIDRPQNALYEWIIHGKVKDETSLYLSRIVCDLLEFRKDNTREVPDVPFELLTSLELNQQHWNIIARNAPWQMTRMNLNTFLRKGVYEDKETVQIIAEKLANPELIKKSRVMPYQLFTTWLNINDEIPEIIVKSLEKALKVSLTNIPTFEDRIHIFVDVSGSMSNPVTGYRKGSTSKMKCVDVAALIASAFLYTNPSKTKIRMFDTKLHSAQLNATGNIMDNAKVISQFGGGGTCCELPLEELVRKRRETDLIIYISDNESWVDLTPHTRQYRSTKVAAAWAQYKVIHPNAKMVCIDLVPNATTQISSRKDVLNIGGFSDNVFQVIHDFVNQGTSESFWVDTIEDQIFFQY